MQSYMNLITTKTQWQLDPYRGLRINVVENNIIWYSSLQRIDEYLCTSVFNTKPVYVHSLFARMIRAVFNRGFHIWKSVSSEQLLGTLTHSNSMPKLFFEKYNVLKAYKLCLNKMYCLIFNRNIV